MDIQNFIAEFKKTFVYDMLKDYVTDEKLFDHFVTENGDIVFLKEQTRQMWSMWQAAKAQAVPEGFVLMPVNNTTIVAIEKMVEQQVEASGITEDVFRLDGEKILNAAVEAARGGNE